jgi:glucose/arabinose dehydrogenase
MFRWHAKAAGATIAAATVLVASAQGAGAPPPPAGQNGATVEQFAAGLATPTAFAFGDGTVFEGDGGPEKGPPAGGVYTLVGGKGVKLAGSPAFVGGLSFHDGTLYVSGGVVAGKGATWEIQAWSGWNGATFASRKVIWTGPKKLDGLNGIAFAPGGRLLVGIDVGLTDNNDHGPANLTPDVYDILSMSATGKNVKVYARGIRQPWQMVFAPGSSTPLVSDLGPDKGTKNPPDYVLKVHPGDDYGFPKCNGTVAAACEGFTKPFKVFGPHTDIMGLAIIGKTLYMTSFTGVDGKGPGGEVLSMPLDGGPVTTVATGFVAPTVGLGESGGSLYVGELTGQVFKVTP